VLGHIAGATACKADRQYGSLPIFVPDLSQQFDIVRNSTAKWDNRDKNHAVFIWIGSVGKSHHKSSLSCRDKQEWFCTDVSYLAESLTNGASFSDAMAKIPVIATCIKKTVEAVLRSGFKSVIVSNVHNIGVNPVWKAAAVAYNISDSHFQQLLFAISVMINQLNDQIESDVSELAQKYSGSNRRIRTFDMYSLYYRLLRDGPPLLGLTNITDPCLQVSVWYDASGNPSSNTLLGTCAAPSNYLFWDAVHPTTVGHRLLSKYIKNALMQHSSIFSA
jgi:hypothetical protein